MQKIAPKHLSPAARKVWRELRQQYEVTTDAGLLLLTLAAESWDRVRRLREQIDTDGETTKDRFGQVKPHPLLVGEKQAKDALLAALRALEAAADDAPKLGRWPTLADRQRAERERTKGRGGRDELEDVLSPVEAWMRDADDPRRRLSV